MLDGPGDSVRRPDQDYLELVMPGISQHLIEPRAPGLRPTDPVRILFDDLVPALLGHHPEIMELGLRVLVQGRDTHVEGGALHKRTYRLADISEIGKGPERRSP